MKGKYLLMLLIFSLSNVSSQNVLHVFAFDTNKVINYCNVSEFSIDGCIDGVSFCKKRASISYFSFVDWQKLQATVTDIYVSNMTTFPTSDVCFQFANNIGVAFVDTVDVKQFCSSFPNASRVFFSFLPLIELDDNVSLSKLEELNVIDVGRITISSSFAVCSNLKKLFISSNVGIDERLLESIWAFKNLEELVLFDEIDCNVPQKFNSSVSIKKGYFSVSKDICKTNFFDQLFTFDNLKDLTIGSNGVIKNLNSVKFNQGIDTLKLVDCIKEMPKSIQKLVGLKKMALNYHNFKDFDFDLSMFTSLISLDLSSNKIKSFNSDLSKLNTLVSLNLSKNKLKYIPKSVYELAGLKYLDLSDNNITEITDDIIKMKSLEVLIIPRNKIKYISPQIMNLPNLRKVVISPWDNEYVKTHFGKYPNLFVFDKPMYN